MTYKFLIIFLILFISCTDTKQYTNPEHIVAKSLVIVDDYNNKRIELNTSSGHARIVIYNENEIPRIILYSNILKEIIMKSINLKVFHKLYHFIVNYQLKNLEKKIYRKD